MNKGRAEQLIVISLFVFMASEVGNHLLTKGRGKSEKKSLTKRVTSGFLTFLFCALAAEAAPEVGALLAVSVATYAFFHDGLPAITKAQSKGVTGGVEAGGGPKRTPQEKKIEEEVEKGQRTLLNSSAFEASPVQIGIDTAGVLI